jgi:hypothetical protein
MIEAVRAVLFDAQERGFVGSVDLDQAIAHALRFIDDLEPPTPRTAADLGSGAGLPGLVLAAIGLPSTRWSLVERSRARADFLVRVVHRLQLGGRVRVEHCDVQAFARSEGRHQFDLVVARSFAPLPSLLEYGAPLLVAEGRIITSVAPELTCPEILVELGLQRRREWSGMEGRFVEYRLEGDCPDRYPRAPATLRARPLF